MNERIKELAEQAEQFANETVDEKVYNRDFTFGSIDDVYNKKFAELIVRECADLCLKHETFQGLFNEMEYRKGRHFNTIIKYHFGIEE